MSEDYRGAFFTGEVLQAVLFCKIHLLLIGHLTKSPAQYSLCWEHLHLAYLVKCRGNRCKTHLMFRRTVALDAALWCMLNPILCLWHAQLQTHFSKALFAVSFFSKKKKKEISAYQFLGQGEIRERRILRNEPLLKSVAHSNLTSPDPA